LLNKIFQATQRQSRVDFDGSTFVWNCWTIFFSSSYHPFHYWLWTAQKPEKDAFLASSVYRWNVFVRLCIWLCKSLNCSCVLRLLLYLSKDRDLFLFFDFDISMRYYQHYYRIFLTLMWKNVVKPLRNKTIWG